MRFVYIQYSLFARSTQHLVDHAAQVLEPVAPAFDQGALINVLHSCDDLPRNRSELLSNRVVYIPQVGGGKRGPHGGCPNFVYGLQEHSDVAEDRLPDSCKR